MRAFSHKYKMTYGKARNPLSTVGPPLETQAFQGKPYAEPGKRRRGGRVAAERERERESARKRRERRDQPDQDERAGGRGADLPDGPGESRGGRTPHATANALLPRVVVVLFA